MNVLQLGKIGDVLSLFPILYDDFKRTGQKPTLIISKEYSHILDRIDYVTPHVWNGHWQDLHGAIRYCKQNFDRAIVPQIYGNDFPIAKLTPSFQLDQWLRAGRLQDWDTLPLILPRPLKAQKIPPKPFILYSDHSQSSPFSKKDELHRLLVDYFGTTHKIVRLSEVRCESPLDLLAFFDAADCLVTVETMMLHLSAASTVPTVALIADSPTRWKGSAWSNRFLAHIRYSDYENRKEDIVRAVRRAVNKSSVPTLRLFKTAHEYGYNPSIIEHGNKSLISYRHHPDPKSWRTELAMTDGVQTWKIEVPRFNDHSLEDMRLFEFQGKLHGGFTIARSADGFFKCVCAYGELVFGGQSWSVLNPIMPKYGRNDFSAMEKNFCFWEHSGKLYCTYQNAPEHIVLELDGARVVKEYKTPSPKCDYGIPRGGTQQFSHNGQLLRFCHAFQKNEKSDQYWTYHLMVSLIEPQPPFTITKFSSAPILTGTEQYFHGWPRWKPRCLLPYGAVRNGDGFTVSCGINDSACATVNLTSKDLNL